jgi:hypothetical protein
MTIPANLTYNQIEERVMNSLRIPVSNATERAKVSAVINETYRDICAKQDWWWLKKRVGINTEAKITAGTVSVIEASRTVEFSDVPRRRHLDSTLVGGVMWLLGWKLFIPGQAADPGAIYPIAVHTVGEVDALLESYYTGPTDSAAGYRLYADSYPLPLDCDKVLSFQRFGRMEPATRVGIEEMLRIKQTDTSEGPPELYSVYDHYPTGDLPDELPTNELVLNNRLLQIHPYPDKAYRMEIWYKQHLNTELFGTTQPYLPDSYRQVLVYGALSRAYPIFLNDTERGQVYLGLFNDLMALMSAQNKEYADDKTMLVPDMSPYRRRQRRPRTAYTLGEWFDRLPNWP